MNYQEAHDYIYHKCGDNILKILILIAEDDTVGGLSFLKKLTSCDDDTAKKLWEDLNSDYGTSETNPMIKANEELTPQEIARVNAIAREWQNKPKCPTCSSTNIKKISTTSKLAGAVTLGLFSKTARSQFQCKNCGYKW